MSGKKRSKKPNEQIKPRTISKAPPPVPKIRGGGYDPIRSKQPDWSLWNKMPALSINECVKLLINVDPKATYLDHSRRTQYDRVSRLVQSYQEVGELPSFDTNIPPHEFFQWAVSIDEKPPGKWKPIGGRKAKAEPAKLEVSTDPSGTIEPIEKQVHSQKRKNDPEVDELREAAVQLCLKKVRDGVVKQYITVVKISKELYEIGRFSDESPFSSKWHSPETIRGFLKRDHNPKSDERVKKAKPDKARSFNQPFTD